MLLHHGESLLRSAYAVLEGEEVPNAAHGPGVLYLTTHRLVFESGRARGISRGQSTRTVLDASLHEVRNVVIPRRRLGRERLVVELTLGRPSFDVLDPQAWAGAIAQAKRALPIGGVAPTTLIERQVVKVRCRFCGHLGNEVDGRCASCGASL
jgi:hypothetical protein